MKTSSRILILLAVASSILSCQQPSAPTPQNFKAADTAIAPESDNVRPESAAEHTAEQIQ